GHLAAFEAVDRHAGACRLALAAATTGLANAGANTTTNTDANFIGAGIVAKFIQTGHLTDLLSYSPTTRTRCGSLLIIPRTSGVSISSRCLFILLSPRPIRGARCTLSRRIGEPTCLTVIIFLSAMVSLRQLDQASTAVSPRRA